MGRAEFSDRLYLDFQIDLSREPGNRAWFGRDVLDGLIEGIDDFVQQRQPRWKRDGYRVGAPVMLGCSPWVSDKKLLAAIEALPGACILVSKPRRTDSAQAQARRLRAINERTAGIELRALSSLGDVAPKVNGQPQVIGPYSRIHEEGEALQTFRTIGFRSKEGEYLPIAHAKLALLGHICWTDEDPMGGVDDYLWFRARRVWVSSANFTYPSRRSLEFGYWTEDEDIVRGVERFLVGLIRASEDLDSAVDAVDPELVEVDYDEDAMAEAYADQELADEEWEELHDEDES